MRSLAPKTPPQQQGSPQATVGEAKATQASPPHIFQRLQQTAGNQAVLRMLGMGATGSGDGPKPETARPASSSRSNPPSLPLWGAPLQTKLKVNSPGDAYEQEADRVATQVMRRPEPEVGATPKVSAGATEVQRQSTLGGTRSDCQKKKSDNKSAELPMKNVSASDIGQTEAPPIVHEVLRSPGQPLDAATRAFMEPRFGQDFGAVRVYPDSHAASSAKQIHARAYSVGHRIVFGDGQFSPQTTEGKSLLAHELAHVVQASGPATDAAPPNSSVEGLEQEARQVANAVRTDRGIPSIRGVARGIVKPLRDPDTDDPGVPTFGNLPRDEPQSGVRLKLQEIGGKWYEILPGREANKRRAAGWYDFVVQDGNIWAVKAKSGFGHTEAARGGRVALAGQIRFTSHSGQITELNQGSGHYRPSLTFARQAAKQFGLPSDSNVFKSHPDTTPSKVQLPVFQPKPEAPAKVPGGTARPTTTTSDSTTAAQRGPVTAKGTELTTETSPTDAHRPGGASATNAHQDTKLPNQASPVVEHQTPEIGTKGRPDAGPPALKGGGPIEAFNKLMTAVWLVDMLQIILGSGSFEQKAVAVGKSAAIGTLSGAALETLVGSELAGPVGFFLTLRSDNAQFNREQEINELIDNQTDDLMEKLGNWTDSHPPPAENPWGVHGRAQARQYIIDKLVAEQEQKLAEAKRMAQQKAEEEEAKRQDAMHADPPGAAEYLGDPFPL